MLFTSFAPSGIFVSFLFFFPVFLGGLSCQASFWPFIPLFPGEWSNQRRGELGIRLVRLKNVDLEEI